MDRFEEAKAKIKDAVDLVSLVERYLPLKRAGRNMVGLCPFHAEKTPSFTVAPATQHYKCFGCGKAGDVFSFLMEREGLDFRTAFEQLAERAGVSIDGVFKGGGQDQRGARTATAQTLATVNAFFQASLQSGAGEAARAYLDRRGLLVAAESFGLGFHPLGGELLRFAQARKLPVDVLQASGLIGRDGQREMFAGRVMFPIVDEGGRIVGFGGRVLAAGQEPKYLNSPESPFFNKRRLLFGLRQVKQLAVRKLVVVEGYTDVIACHLAGVTGAVATLGTSLTQDHARLLLRYAHDGVVLLFDGDRAGRQAAERALRELCNVELPVRIAFLDEGIDPADLLQVAPGGSEEATANGRARMAEILAQAEDPIVAWFKLLRQRYDFQDAVASTQAATECAQLLAVVESPVRREAMLRRMAPWFGGDEGALRRLIKVRGAGGHQSGALSPAAAAPAQPAATPGSSKPMARPASGAPTHARGKWRRGHSDPIPPLDDTAVARLLGSGPAVPPRQPATPAAPSAAPAAAAPIDPALREAEVDLLACVLALPALHHRLAAPDLADPHASEVLAAITLCLRALPRDEGASQGEPQLAFPQLVQAAFSHLSAHAPQASALLAEAVERVRHIREPEAAFASTDQRRRQYVARKQARRVRVALEEARVTGDSAKVEHLTRLFYAQLRPTDQPAS
jgi:DNA primase